MTAKKPGANYTMTEAALAQRRAAQPLASANATGPNTPEGKAASSRNGWKHGRYSAINRAQFGQGATSLARMFGKPCVTTCPFHPDNPDRTEAPCSLVLDGLTHAGGSCLDKTVYVYALDALMSAMTEGDMDGMHGMLATQVASNMQVLQQIREEIAQHGVMVAIPLLNKEGEPVIDPKTNEPYIAELRANPVLAHLIKFSESLGINLAELMATPRARQRLQDDDDAAGAMQAMIGAIFRKAGNRLPPPKDD